MAHHELLLRLVVASVLGSLIGLERHRSDKAAGMRTHMLVSLGSALVMIVSAYGFDTVIRPSRVVLDPSRIAAQVVSGIGFLGAGTILRRDERVLGLTTAASIWAVAAVGLACGGGLYVAAGIATGLVLIILTAVKSLEERFDGHHHRCTLSLIVGQDEFSPADVEAVLQQDDLKVKGFHIGPDPKPGQQRVTLTFGKVDHAKLLALIDRVNALKGVRELDFESGPTT